MSVILILHTWHAALEAMRHGLWVTHTGLGYLASRVWHGNFFTTAHYRAMRWDVHHNWWCSGGPRAWTCGL